MPHGKFPDPSKGDRPGPFFDHHVDHFGIALQRALDDCPAGEHDNAPINFSADIIKTNPGGIKEYQVQIQIGP